MKTKIISLLLAAVMCISLLTGCAAIRGLEKDVQVICEVGGECTGVYTVNIFNNAVVPAPTPPEGKVFLGWTPVENWEEVSAEELPIAENTELIRYDDVKDYITKNALSITLYAAFEDIPERDLVIAWYNKTTTSGLDSEAIEAFEKKLYEYLSSEGYSVDEMDILLRGYEGNVGDTCAAIQKDGDVDIMLGWSSSSNLTGTGGLTEGVDFLENVGGVAVGSKERYVARKNDKELTLKVYAWIQNEYGAGAAGQTPGTTAPEPTPDTSEPTAANKLTVGWYAKTGTSGLDEGIISAFTEGLRLYLTAEGVDLANIPLTVRAYDGSVDDVQTAVLADGDVDIMVGMKKFALDGVYMEVQEDVAMGDKTDRRIHKLTNTDLSNLVFQWLATDEGRAAFLPGYVPTEPAPKPSSEPEPTQDPGTQESVLTVGWYAKTDTSGLDEAIMANVQSAMESYLAAQGKSDVSLTVRAYDGSVDEVQTAVLADGDVDIMVGMKKFALDGVDMEVQEDVAMGDKTDRRIHKLTDTEAANLVFQWLETDEARAAFLSGQGPEEPDPSQEPTPTQEPDPSQEPEPTQEPAPQETVLTVGWYAKTGTSGLDETIMAKVQQVLEAYLAAQGQSNVTLTVRAYDGSVDEVQSAVLADGDVDIMLGMKKFALDGIDMEVQEDVAMGDKTDRRIHKLTDTEAANLAFQWLATDEARAAFLSGQGPEEPEPTQAPAPQETVLTVGWYAKTGTSGLDETIMARVQQALEAYLAAQGQADVTLTVRAYDGSVDEVQSAVLADGDVDIMVGMKKFALDGIDMEVQEDVAMGDKTDRRIHKLTDTEAANLVFQWLATDEARSNFVSA